MEPIERQGFAKPGSARRALNRRQLGREFPASGHSNVPSASGRLTRFRLFSGDISIDNL
jgi:hypothetical protein